MIPIRTKRKIRHRRVRAKVHGTVAQPRLSVYRSTAFIYAQLIDDSTGTTLVSIDDRKLGKMSKVDRSKKVGLELAKKALAKKISKVVFDRSGYLYTGRVRALADGAREGGLQF